MYFNVNKYTRIYFEIISRAASENRSKENGYYEKHHITPRSLGGTDVAWNLVLLTAREHYLCHWLLIKMVKPGEVYKMQFAFFRMCSVGRGQKRTITSAQYEVAKKHNQMACSDRNKNHPVIFERTDEIKAKMSAAKKDKVRMHHKSNNHLTWVHVDDVPTMMAIGYVNGSGINQVGANNAMYGRTHTQETKDKMRATKKGKKWNGTQEGIEAKRRFMKDNNPSHDPEVIAKIVAKISKTYIVTHPDGRAETITNMAAYCREHGLHPGNMTSVARGVLKHYKGMVVRYA